MTLAIPLLRPHQKEIIQLARTSIVENSSLFIYGGKGVFKTSTMVYCLYYWLKLLSMYYSGLRVIVAASSYQQIRDVFVESWAEQSNPADWEYQDSRTTISLIGTETKIWLRYAGDGAEGASAEKASKGRRGSNITGYYFPQCESVSFGFFNEISSRLRGEPNKKNKVNGELFQTYPPYQIKWIDSNPEGDTHWLKRLFLDDGPDSIKESCHSKCIKTTVETSVYSSSQIEQFRKTWPEHEVSRMIDARWVGASGQVFWIRDQHKILDSLPNPRYYLSFDFGYEDEFVCLLIESKGKHIFIKDEASIRRAFKSTHLSIVKTMLEKNGNPKLSGIAGDYAGTYHDDKVGTVSSMWWFGIQLQIQVMRTQKDRYDGMLKMLEMLETQGELFNRPLLTMHAENCKRTSASLGSLIWHKSKHDVEANSDDHHADAARYACMSQIQQT